MSSGYTHWVKVIYEIWFVQLDAGDARNLANYSFLGKENTIYNDESQKLKR